MSASNKTSPAPKAPDNKEGYQTIPVKRWQSDQTLEALDHIAEEVPVALIYNGISHVVMMASPNNLSDFAIGFSLTEGIVECSNEIYEIESQQAGEKLHQGLELHITISSEKMAALKQRRRNLMGRTGCGLCGAESLQQAIRPAPVVTQQPCPTSEAIDIAITSLNQHQPLQSLTGALHGAAWCDNDGNIQLIREDVGRHNALDKLIGAFEQRNKQEEKNLQINSGFLLISSRASYEMIQKAAHANFSTLVAVSAPTALALELAQHSGINLIGFGRPGRHVIYHQNN